MQVKRYPPHVFVVAACLLLLGLLGAYWPTFVDASSLGESSAPSDIIGDGITYQGYLTDASDLPLSGQFTMRFQIYNAKTGGAVLSNSGNREVTVQDGHFAVRLAITTDIFNGEALWLQQTINGEVLTPRQEILPAPMAHTLRPGAIIKGTATAFPNNYLLDVQMNNDVYAFNRGAVFAQSTTGNAIYALANTGRALYGQTQDGYAVYGFDGGSNANRGYAGYFYSTNGVGVYGYSNGDRAHPNILAPAIYGQSNQGVGVYGRGDTSDSYSFYNEGGYFEGGKGLYARGTDPASQSGYGARIYSDQYHGMYVRGGENHYAAYFDGTGGINTHGIVDRSASSQALVMNGGNAAIEPGDLVAMLGVHASPESGESMLSVAKLDSDNRSAVIGVAKEAIAAEITSLDDESQYVDFVPMAGASVPGNYLVIITGGLAPAVHLTSLAVAGNLEIGERMAVSASGEMGVSTPDTDEIVVGKVAGPIDETTGTVPMFIDID